MKVVGEVKELEREAGETLSALLQIQERVEPRDVLGRFEEPFERLRGEFGKEYEELGLDEVVVAALTPLVRSSSPVRFSLILPKLTPSLHVFHLPSLSTASPPLAHLGPPLVPLLHRSLPSSPPPSLPPHLFLRTKQAPRRPIRGRRTTRRGEEAGEGEDDDELREFDVGGLGTENSVGYKVRPLSLFSTHSLFPSSLLS
jgi:hypothetical protein